MFLKHIAEAGEPLNQIQIKYHYHVHAANTVHNLLYCILFLFANGWLDQISS